MPAPKHDDPEDGGSGCGAVAVIVITLVCLGLVILAFAVLLARLPT